MRRSQKLGIAALLCVSALMIVIALIRAIGPVDVRSSISAGSRNVDAVWALHCSEIEAFIVVIMPSVIVIRSVFLRSHPRGTPSH